jgi:hypothetical protein
MALTSSPVPIAMGEEGRRVRANNNSITTTSLMVM